MQQRHQRTSKDKSAPITVPAEAGLGFYLREAYRAFSRQFHVRLARQNITHAQWVLLWFLSQAGSLTPITLSREAGIQKASATAVIESLKKRRLIRADPDRNDRRKVNLSLTPAGAELMKELIAYAAETNALAQRGQSSEEHEILFRLLRNVTANLEKSNEERHDPA